MHGGVAQLARAFGSYPDGRKFKSYRRYQDGPLVKRLRHRPFTAESGVRFPYGSPQITCNGSNYRLFYLKVINAKYRKNKRYV